jgi:Phytanoyl-CoA dioxygenase (PhyH)
MFSLFTGAKSFKTNRWVGSARLNQLGLHVGRKRVADGLAALRRLWLGRAVPEADRGALAKDGLLVKTGFLPQEELAALRRELLSALWPMLEMVQPPAATRRVNLDAQLCAGKFPALARLIVNPAVLHALRYAAGCPGTPIVSVQIIRSQGVDAGHDPQTDWHRDTFHAAGKAWLFLHDVPADQGPFAFVPGSHRLTPAHWGWEKAQSVLARAETNSMHANGSFRIDEAGLNALGYPTRFTADVAGNTLVVADMSGFHRRTPSTQPTVRIEIYFSLRRNPFFAGLLPSVLGLPFVRRHWGGWVYGVCSALLARGTHSWIPLGLRPLEGEERQLLTPTEPVPGLEGAAPP